MLKEESQKKSLTSFLFQDKINDVPSLLNFLKGFISQLNQTKLSYTL